MIVGIVVDAVTVSHISATSQRKRDSELVCVSSPLLYAGVLAVRNKHYIIFSEEKG